jgi:acetyl-CoA carboxylase carboxyltransferase component
VFCVVGRYHGGAFVVFSKRLNPNLTVLAVAGARASVIGGAPAANVVLSGEARRRARTDDRVAALEADLQSITGPERLRIGLDLADVRDSVQAQKLDELAHEFDRVHDVDRAVAVGSVDAVIAPHDLRPALISAVESALSRSVG